jgi:KipI family sensor histidine kinase inhibitor
MPHARRTSGQGEPSIEPAGEGALVVRLGTTIERATHQRVLSLLEALDAAPPPGLLDLTPTYATILVQFDPLRTSAEAIAEHVRRALAAPGGPRRAHGRLVRLPVHYGGEDGPDLKPLARELGLAPDDVVKLHAGAEYHVYFLGFVAGFPYLGGLPPELAAPRLPAPRTRVPAGSVGIAGYQTGVYPAATPGGWRIIGRTPATLFDPAAEPPSLLRPGDRVRFVPTPAPALFSNPGGAAGGEVAVPEGAAPWLRIVRPGPMTTVQDPGRHGYARFGVSTSGAADGDALRLGNALLGNVPGAAALEVTLGGLVAEALSDCAVALTGAECEARVNGEPLPPGTVQVLTPGDRVELGAVRRGVRAYLAVAGGVAVAPVLGSAATDVRAGMGGFAGRALAAGDVAARGLPGSAVAALAGRRLPPDPERRFPTLPEPWRIRVAPGQHTARPGDHSDMLGRLTAGAYVVDARSDRVGVRLTPKQPHQHALAGPGDLLSEGMPRGAVQVPPDGAPVILLADHQTTGGYVVPAVVIAADLWKVAQLRPGDALRLELVTREDAVAALRARDAWLTSLAAGAGALSETIPSERLMRGFSEWSEEASEHE